MNALLPLGLALNPAAPLSSAGVIGATVCLVWAAGLAVWCALKLRRRGSGKRRLIQRALERGFERHEALSLWRLGRYAEGGRREAILDSCEAFDRCVRAAEEATGDDPELRPEYLAGSVTSALRRKYGGPRRSLRRIADTREIEQNQPVHVCLADGAAFKSFVLNVTDESLELSLPGSVQLAASGLADRSACVSFWRPHDARYEWTSRVIGEGRATGATESRLGVAHAPLSRVQEREFVRVRCRQEIRFGLRLSEAETGLDEARQEPPELPFTAMLNDLSNGGASFVTDKPLAAGTTVLLRIQLTRKPWALTLPARLLRQIPLGGTSNPSWHSSIRFEQLTGRMENHLSRFIADLQRRLIARMLSRAGTEEQDTSESIAENKTKQESPAWARHTESGQARPDGQSSGASSVKAAPEAAVNRERERELEAAHRVERQWVREEEWRR